MEKNPLQTVLEREIDASSHGAAELNVVTRTGAFDGAVKRDAVEGVFRARVVLRDSKTGQLVGQADAFFRGEDVMLLSIPVKNPLIEPAGVLPARVKI